MRTYIFLLFTFLCIPIYSQDVLLEEEVLIDSSDLRFGPNGTYFYHSLIKFGFILGDTKHAIKYGKSSSISVGGRFKRKLNTWADVHLSIQYVNQAFHFNQDSLKLFPSLGVHEKEKLAYHQIQAELALRLNSAKRGNIIKTFLDIGFFGSYATQVNHLTLDKNLVSNAGFTETRNYDLSYVEPFSYGPLLRLGYKHFSIYGSYQMNSFFKKSYPISDLPKFALGIEWALF